MAEHAALLNDLAAWSEQTRNFHADRQLADHVLLAAGWRCLPDPEHPAKVKWEFGTNPVVTCWEPYTPHPINSIDPAIQQLPFNWRMRMMMRPNPNGEWGVEAAKNDRVVVGFHTELAVAISIAVVRAWKDGR